MNTGSTRIVLACSGGVVSTAAIPWLAEQYRAEIVTVTLDLGQAGQGELEDVRDRALAAGAVRAHVIDARDELARDFVVRAHEGEALDAHRQPMAAALSRPVIARRLVEIAGIEHATAVAHGGSPETGDRSRLDAAIAGVDPSVRAIAVAAEWRMTRQETVDYAHGRGLPLALGLDNPDRVDTNTWGRTVIVEQDSAAPPDERFTLTKSAAQCPGEPAFVEIAFERGMPVALNGVSMPVADLIANVAMIAGSHGVGRLPAVRLRTPGRPLWQLIEAPAAVVLHAAHAELQKLVATKETMRFSRRVSRQYAHILDAGLWFDPVRDAIDAYVAKTQERVSGAVRLRLFKGDCSAVGRSAVEPKPAARTLRVVASKTH